MSYIPCLTMPKCGIPKNKLINESPNNQSVFSNIKNTPPVVYNSIPSSNPIPVTNKLMIPTYDQSKSFNNNKSHTHTPIPTQDQAIVTNKPFIAIQDQAVITNKPFISNKPASQLPYVGLTTPKIGMSATSGIISPQTPNIGIPKTPKLIDQVYLNIPIAPKTPTTPDSIFINMNTPGINTSIGRDQIFLNICNENIPQSPKTPLIMPNIGIVKPNNDDKEY